MLEMEKPRIECTEKEPETNYASFVIEPWLWNYAG